MSTRASRSQKIDLKNRLFKKLCFVKSLDFPLIFLGSAAVAAAHKSGEQNAKYRKQIRQIRFVARPRMAQRYTKSIGGGISHDGGYESNG